MSYNDRTSPRRNRPSGGRLSSTGERVPEGRRISRTRSSTSARGDASHNARRRDQRLHDERLRDERRHDERLRVRETQRGPRSAARGRFDETEEIRRHTIDHSARRREDWDAETSPATEERGRIARRANRAPRKRTRSVGADVLSFPASQANGLNLRINRPYGRGSTAQLVQDQRGQTGVSRPAVYTQEKVGLRDRVRIARRWGTGLHLNVWYVALAALLAIALAAAAIMGPLRDYYIAWRDAGRLDVEYAVVSEINETLADDVERLNTLEGIEDEARRRGYVYPDEEAVVVEGLEDVEPPAEEEEVKAALDEYEQGLPWYVHALDGLLGYRKG